MEVYYHRKCNRKFAHSYFTVEPQTPESRETLDLDTFIKVVKEKCAFLLHELLNDLIGIWDDVGLQVMLLITGNH